MAVEEVTFVGTTLAGVQENVVHFYNPDGAATHAAIAADLQTNWINPLLNLHNNNFTWVSMNIRTVDPTGGVTSTHPVSPWSRKPERRHGSAVCKCSYSPFQRHAGAFWAREDIHTGFVDRNVWRPRKAHAGKLRSVPNYLLERMAHSLSESVRHKSGDALHHPTKRPYR